MATASKAPRRNRSKPSDPAFEKTREKIQASQIVNRVQDHALGKNKMSTTQLRAAEILLKKVLPDLTSAHLNVEDHREPVTAIVYDPAENTEAWLEEVKAAQETKH